MVVRARSPSQGSDDGRLAEGLLALGGRAVQEVEGWWITHLDPSEAPAPDDVTARLAALTEISDLDVDVRWQEHRDWAELWKRGLAPRRVGERLVVTPSWCEVERLPGDVVLTLDPGMAFGNAEHGTTRGCLRLLESSVRGGDRLLDVGTGSGVLSIAAVHLGAAAVLALDGDRWAVGQARENLEANGVSARVRVEEHRVDSPSLAALGSFDGVIANIERGLLVPLLDGLVGAVDRGGWLLLSGILAPEWDDFAELVTGRGCDLEALDEDGEWRSACFRTP